MSKKKQKLIDKPTEDTVKRLFPKKVVERAKEIAHKKDSK